MKNKISSIFLIILSIVSVAFISQNVVVQASGLGSWTDYDESLDVRDAAYTHVPSDDPDSDAVYLIGGVNAAGDTAYNTIRWSNIDDTTHELTGFQTSSVTLPDFIYDAAASYVEIGGTKLIYVTGGRKLNTQHLQTIYKITVDSSTGEPLSIELDDTTMSTPAARHQMIIREMNGVVYMYILGGRASTFASNINAIRATIDGTGDVSSFSTINIGEFTVNSYDSSAQIINVNSTDYLVMTGGYTSSDSENLLVNAWNMDPDTGDLTNMQEITGMNYLLSSHTTQVVGTDLYVIGGRSEDFNDVPGGREGSIVDMYTFTYNIGNDSIQTVGAVSQPQLPVPLGSHGSAAVDIGADTYIYTFGGKNNDGAVGDVNISEVDGVILTPSPEFEFFKADEDEFFGDYVTYRFDVTDDNDNLVDVEVSLDGGARESVDSFDLSIDSQFEEFEYYLYRDEDILDNLDHTVQFFATDASANETSSAIYTFSFSAGSDSDDPEINITAEIDGLITYPDTTELNYEFSVADATSKINYAAWSLLPVLDGASYDDLNSLDGMLNELTEDFQITLDAADYADLGEYNLSVFVEDQAGNAVYYDWYFEVVTVGGDAVPPVFDFFQADEGTITTGTTLTYDFNVSDALSVLDSVEYKIDAGARTPIEAADSPIDSLTEDFYLELDAEDFDDDTAHTITFYATDIEANEAEESFTFTIDIDFSTPYIDFTETHSGLTPERFHFIGTGNDNLGIRFIQYQFGSQGFVSTPYDFGESSSTLEQEFDFNFSATEIGLDEGAETLHIFITDINGNVTDYNYTLDLDITIPSCTATWPNLETPHYSNVVTYPQFNCTDNRGITSAEYDVYHAVHNYQFQDVAISPVDTTFGGTSENFTFTFELDPDENLDGRLIQTFRAYDAAGNVSFDEDEIAVEYNDDSDPILKVDQISPDPTTDTTPKLTGSCGDITNFDTNTFISNISYSIDAGLSNDITPLSGEYDDSYSESFSIDLTELSIGLHTVNVTCTDGDNRIVDIDEDFEVEPVDENAEPGEFVHTDNFTNHDFQDIANTSLIWGNGQLRLKEDITIDRDLITSSGYLPKYSPIRNDYRVIKDLVNPNLIWFSTLHAINTYNVSTDTITTLDINTIFGAPNSSDIKDMQVSMYNGDQILWFSTPARLYAYNITENQGISTAYSEFANIGMFVPDTERGRLGAYFLTESSALGAGENELTYWNLNNTLTVTGDDTIYNYNENMDGLVVETIVEMNLKPGTNYLYLAPYGTGRIVKLDDGDTPENQADDITDSYLNADYITPFSYSFDPDNNLIIGTDNNSAGSVFIVTDEGGTDMDLTDDTIVRLSSPIDIGYKGVANVEYIEGVDNVGNQLLITTSSSIPYYMNFNSTYEDRLDDTFIPLPVDGGSRPGRMLNVMHDYNTFFSNNSMQGFYRINLNRGWESSGQAIGVPQRPSNKLILQNFTADANPIDPIAFGPAIENQNASFIGNLANLLIPSVDAAPGDGITYEISNDDGVTWSPISLGELKQLSPANYNVKFRINMTTVGGATPVLNSYTLDFAGYTTPEQAEEVDDVVLINTPGTVPQNTNFSLIVQAVDVFGFPVIGDSSIVSLQLIDTTTNNPVSGLNKTNVTLTDGEISLADVQIDSPGTYVIRGTSGSFSGDSPQITVTPNVSNPTPALSFYADKYTIQPGESVTLGWSSSYLDTLTITPDVGTVASSGTRTVTPTQTTRYIISGSGPYGSLSAGFNVTVVDENGEEIPASFPSAEGEIIITTIDDQVVNRGDKVNFTWSVENANYVYIDYLGREVADEGNFEFIANENVDISITATNGSDSETKVVRITVLNLPFAVGNLGPLTPVIQFISKLPAAELLIFAGLNLLLFFGLLLNILNTGAFNITLSTLENILRVMGILPFKKRKGYVYQTKSIKGVSFARININSLDENKIMASIITDMEGTYYEPFVAKGNYNLDVKQADNMFPTNVNRPAQLSVYDFYKGEHLNVSNEKEQQAIVIPMDTTTGEIEESSARSKLLLFINRTLIWLQWTVYPMWIFSLIAAFVYPSLINTIIGVIYSAMILVKVITALKPATLKLKLMDKATMEGIPNAFVELRDTSKGLVAIGKTNKSGVAKFYVEKDVYSVSINATNFVSSEGFGEQKLVDLSKDNDYEFYLLRSR